MKNQNVLRKETGKVKFLSDLCRNTNEKPVVEWVYPNGSRRWESFDSEEARSQAVNRQQEKVNAWEAVMISNCSENELAFIKAMKEFNCSVSFRGAEIYNENLPEFLPHITIVRMEAEVKQHLTDAGVEFEVEGVFLHTLIYPSF